MSDDATGKPTKAPHLRLIVNEDYVDPVEEAAAKFADRLIAQYDAMTAGSPAAFSNTITVIDYPEERVVDRAVQILARRGFDAEPVEHNCSGGRAGSVRMTAHDPHRNGR